MPRGSRRRFLGKLGTLATVGHAMTAGSAALAGCTALHPPAAVARGIVPRGEDFLAAATAYPGAVGSGPAHSWVVRVDGGGDPVWARRFPADRWPGQDELFGCCPLDGGALLFGRRTPADGGRPAGLLHAVTGDGTTRWRRSLGGAIRVTDAVSLGDGAVAAGLKGPGVDDVDADASGAAEDADAGGSLVVAVDADGSERWVEAVSSASATTLQGLPRGGAGTAANGRSTDASSGGLVVAGHATRDGDGVPWLLGLVGDAVGDGGSGGGSGGRFERRYDGEAPLRGLSIVSVVGTSDGPVAVATGPGSGSTARPRVELLDLDSDWRLRTTRPLDVVADRIRAADGGARPAFDGDARLVAALPGLDEHPLTLVVASTWTTVATLDARSSRTAETVVPAAAHAARRTGDGTVLLAGARAVGNDDLDAWLAGLGDGGLWTTTLPLAGD